MPPTAEKYFALIARRAAGEPTQYLTGKQEFWGLEFEVTPAVLIPRPETEHVIEVALERLGPRGIKIHMDTGAPSAQLRVADVGTGSGCLAVALAHELPHADDLSRRIFPRRRSKWRSATPRATAWPIASIPAVRSCSKRRQLVPLRRRSCASHGAAESLST